MVNVCCVLKCKNRRRNVKCKLHRFPKNERLRAIWLGRTGNPDLLTKTPQQVYENYRMCDLHFREEDRIHAGRRGAGLTATAITCLHLNPDSLFEYYENSGEVGTDEVDTDRLKENAENLANKVPSKIDNEQLIIELQILCHNDETIKSQKDLLAKLTEVVGRPEPEVLENNFEEDKKNYINNLIQELQEINSIEQLEACKKITARISPTLAAIKSQSNQNTR